MWHDPRALIIKNLFGLGTWLATNGGECKDAVRAALQLGFRLIDTAQMYDNHEDVRAALQELPADALRPFVVAGGQRQTER